MGEQHIILYSSSECTRCQLVKQMLNHHKVKYKEILDDKQLMISKGFEGVPVIEVDGKIIDEYVSVLDWLRQNGYYSLWKEDENESNKA